VETKIKEQTTAASKANENGFAALALSEMYIRLLHCFLLLFALIWQLFLGVSVSVRDPRILQRIHPRA
jgi:flagellar biogenesis protein FliO